MMRDRPIFTGGSDTGTDSAVVDCQHPDYVADVGLQVDPSARQVRALAQAGQRRREDLVPAAHSNGRTHLQACAPDQAPWTMTNLAISKPPPHDSGPACAIGSSLLTSGASSVQPAPDGSTRIQTDRLDHQTDDQGASDGNRMPGQGDSAVSHLALVGTLCSVLSPADH